MLRKPIVIHMAPILRERVFRWLHATFQLMVELPIGPEEGLHRLKPHSAVPMQQVPLGVPGEGLGVLKTWGTAAAAHVLRFRR